MSQEPLAHRLSHMSAAPVSARALDARIEDYLDHVCAPLLGVVPYRRRQELRAELRSHLEALVASCEELGSTPELAVLTALREFGNPRAIGRRCADEWARAAEPTLLQSLWKAMVVAWGCFGLATVLSTGAEWMSMVSPHVHSFAFLPALLACTFMLPLLAGLATGILAPARSVLGSFCSLSTLILLSVGLALLERANPSGVINLATCGRDLVTMQSHFWLPLGCGAAALGGWLLRIRRALQPGGWALQ
jgi:hypothetical protein